MDFEDIKGLEIIADRAWPAREISRGPGWECRFSDGMHRRLNSASVWAADDLAATVGFIEAWFEERGQSPIFKLTAASADGLDEYLTDRGYQPDARVTVMTADLDDSAPEAAADGVEISPEASAEWIDAFATMSGYGDDRRRLLGAVLSRIDLPAAYGLSRGDRTVASVGMAVAEADHAGVFEMFTHPDHRRQGHATTVLHGLLGWMQEQGVRTPYLQVLKGNRPAELLYAASGFVPRYYYWYRVRPGWLSSTPR